MNVETINSSNETILDKIVGVPFFNDEEEIDIVFDIEGEFIYLSELTDNILFENCGWFSRALKKVAKTAAIIAVAAVVVTACAYAAPAVIAVATGSLATTAGTTMFVAGSVATSTLAACATIGAVSTTTAIVASSIAATACLGVISSGIYDKFNKNLESSNKWTEQELQSVLELSIKTYERNLKNTAVYLERDPEYTDVASLDSENNVVYFRLDDWMFYENKHTKEGMWILNQAFLEYVIVKEKNEKWQIRLTTDYNSYLSKRDINQEGYFYSKELNFLIDTGHVFSSSRTYKSYGSFYMINYF